MVAPISAFSPFSSRGYISKGTMVLAVGLTGSGSGGTGGYAGGISWGNNSAGYAIIGDICLEAICSYPLPTAGARLLDLTRFQRPSYDVSGQTGAFIHEALHGLGLLHPDSWPPEQRPGWAETIMGYWWNFPNFPPTNGLSIRENALVQQWINR